MNRRSLPEKPAIVRERKSRPARLSRHTWSAFRRSLCDALGGLEEDEYLIIASKKENYFVQFAGQGDHGMRVEAVSNTFIKKGPPLSDKACQDLINMGWIPPTYVPSDGAGEPAEGSPNFYVDSQVPVQHARLANLAVKTLRAIYHIRHPRELTYKSFCRNGVSIRFPQLKIARETASGRSGNGTWGCRSETPVATAQGAGGPQFMLPDGNPIAAELVEADLRARITKAEEAWGDATWQMARFYSIIGRQEEAKGCVTRLMEAWTDDPGKQAAGYLALGQLLEQHDSYAEAEAAYARGLAILPAAGEVGYFLHNNRGYCLNTLGRHAEAEVHCRAATALDPARHNAHKNLGLALAGQGRYVQAARCLLEADRRWPADERARRHLADLLAAHPEIPVEELDLAAECQAHGLCVGPIGNA
jgi:tetratricopeptide (TPR) repeat protein